MPKKKIRGRSKLRPKEIVILGAGGHAGVLSECLELAGSKVQGFLDKSAPNGRKKILGTDDLLRDLPPQKILLANGLGSIGAVTLRKNVFETGKKMGFTFAIAVHPTAIVSPGASLLEGAQVFAGAIVQTGVEVGVNSIVNTGAIIDHDCRLGKHVHVAPGAVLSGGVEIGDESHVGAGATIIQGVKIGRECVIGAGSTVIRDVPDGTTVVGNPAKAK